MKKRRKLIIDLVLLTALAVFCMALICALSLTQKRDLTLTGDEEVAVVLGDLYPGSCIQKEYSLKLAGRVTFSATFNGEGKLADYIETRVEFDSVSQFDGTLSELFGKPLVKAAENAVTVRVTYTLPSHTKNDLQNADLDLTLTFSQGW